MQSSLREFYTASADAGNPYASLLLARELGQDSPHYLARVTAALPLPEAQWRMYKVSNAKDDLLKAADAGYPDAFLPAATVLLPTDPKTAVEYLRRATTLGDKAAAATLIRHLVTKRELNAANEVFGTIHQDLDDQLGRLLAIVNILRDKAKQHDYERLLPFREQDVEARFFVALFELGQGAPGALTELIDSQDAVLFYGVVGVNACVQLGRAYKLGRGVEKNMATAAEWLERAVERGWDGHAEIAECYEEAKNDTKAFEHYSVAAENGDLGAIVWVGRAFLEARGVDADVDMARLWLEQAADMGSDEAKRILAANGLNPN